MKSCNLGWTFGLPSESCYEEQYHASAGLCTPAQHGSAPGGLSLQMHLSLRSCTAPGRGQPGGPQHRKRGCPEARPGVGLLCELKRLTPALPRHCNKNPSHSFFTWLTQSRTAWLLVTLSPECLITWVIKFSESSGCVFPYPHQYWTRDDPSLDGATTENWN